MQWGAVKAASLSRAAAVLVAGVLLAGCATGPDAATGPDLGDIDPRNFVYRGACGWDKPALDTVLVWGREPAANAEQGEDVSRAQLVGSRRVQLGSPARDLLLVRLQCSIGGATATGWHLLGHEGDRPVDLGIVAASYGPIALDVAAGQLVVEHSYRSTADEGLSDSGRITYRVALAGLTPVRLHGEEQPGDIPAEVADWGADAWRAGLVTLAAPAQADGPSHHLGLQVDRQTVLSADSLAAGEQGCRPPVVRTHTGQRIDPAATQGWSDRTGTRVLLTLPSDTPDVSPAAAHDLRPGEDFRGLLVTGSGLVPALATAAVTSGNEVRVTSSAPDDVALENVPFGRPQAVVRNAAGSAVLAGSWGGDATMAPLPDVSLPSDTGC